MSTGEGKFLDLPARMASGAVLAVIGLAAIYAGGGWFLALIGAVVAIMVWELARMVSPESPPERALALAAAAAAAVVVGRLIPEGFALPLLFLPALAALSVLDRNRTVFVVFASLVMIAAFGLHFQRQEFGFVWIAWLIAVVIVTDVGGYFAGRLIGGPKFWPRVSPKKTWAGTVAGWIASAVVGILFLGATGAGAELIGISVAISMASQIGDIAESAVKRRMGVKDASHLLPGHGGLLDRFDGVLGASVFLLVVEQIVDFPPGLVAP